MEFRLEENLPISVLGSDIQNENPFPVFTRGDVLGHFPDDGTLEVFGGDFGDLDFAADVSRPVLKNILVTTDRSLAESLRARPAEGGVRRYCEE